MTVSASLPTLEAEEAEHPRPAAAASTSPTAPAVRRRARAQLTDATLPAAVGLWAVSVKAVDPGAMNDFGLFPALPIAFFVALAALIASVALVLTQPTLSPVRAALHVAAFVLVLHGTVPMIFAEPNYPWVYKHIGVTRYISLHGGLDAGVDIYQNWPGFFALAAWFDEITSSTSPMAYVAWAPVYFNGLICLQLHFIFRSLHVGCRTRWLALFVFVAGNWVGQDYFAPQALAFVLSLGAFGIVLAWLQADQPPAPVKAVRRLAGRVARERGAGVVRSRLPSPVLGLALLFAVFSAVVVTHQLSPYVVVMGIGALTAVGLVRPRWVVWALAAIAVGYLLLHLSYLESTQDLFGSLFDPMGNVKSNGIGATQAQLGRRLMTLGAPALVLGLWGLGLLGVARRLRAGRPVLAVAVLAAAPALIVLGQSYGGEAVFRIYLFSLPWTALLVAWALEPRRGWSLATRTCVGVLLSVVALLFMCAFYGSVELYRVRPGEVRASQYFYDHAEPGSVLILGTPHFPGRVAANYDRFVSSDSTPNLVTTTDEFRRRFLGPDDVPAISAFSEQYRGRDRGRIYLALTTGQQIYAEVLGLLPAGSLNSLDQALERSDQWRPFYRGTDAAIFELLSADGSGEVAAPVPAPVQSEKGARSVHWPAMAAGVSGLLLLAWCLIRMRRRWRETLAPKQAGTVPDPSERPEALEVGAAATIDAALQSALAGHHAEPELVGDLVAGLDAGERPRAVRLLGIGWGPLSLTHLEPLLADASGALRAATVDVLRVSTEAVPVLLRMVVNDSCADVRVAAVRALAQAPEADQLTALAAVSTDPAAGVRAAAVAALPVVVTDRGATALVTAGEDGSELVRRTAHLRLASAPSWVLWTALRRAHSAELLARLLADAPAKLAAMASERLSSPDPDDRVLAVKLSGRLDARPELLGAMRDPEPAVRLAAAKALVGARHDEAELALVRALQDDDADVRRSAVDGPVARSSRGLAPSLAIPPAASLTGDTAARETLLRMDPTGDAAPAAEKSDRAIAEAERARAAILDVARRQAVDEAARLRRQAREQVDMARATILERARRNAMEQGARLRGDARAEALAARAPVR